MNTVAINFEEKGKESITLSCPKGDSILDMCMQQGIELHHNCGGVCACSTCHIYLNSGEQYVAELNDKEENFIDRARNPKLNSRLACQCVMLNENATVHITIPDQSLLLGD